MTLAEDRDSWSALVAAAQRGDAGAWPPLIDRFEDFAVAAAVGPETVGSTNRRLWAPARPTTAGGELGPPLLMVHMRDAG